MLFHGRDCLVPSLLLVLPLGLWLLGVIVVANCASFMVMLACHHCYYWLCLCFLHGHGCLSPLLLLVVFLLWSWLLGAITVIASYVVVVVNCRHPYYLFFLCGHGYMAPSLLLLFPSWPW
jgi:hypothetical protein